MPDIVAACIYILISLTFVSESVSRLVLIMLAQSV